MGYDSSEGCAEGVVEREPECEAVVDGLELVEVGRCVSLGV